jgi:hypothetical protein
MPVSRQRKRPKVFGPGPCIPLDRNTKIRIQAAAWAYNARHREGRQHWRPLTRATFDCLATLLWGFHNAHDGFPSYERIAERADCCRSTVQLAITPLATAGILEWANRIRRVPTRGVDAAGNPVIVSKVVRTSNAYVFHDPHPSLRATRPVGRFSSKKLFVDVRRSAPR